MVRWAPSPAKRRSEAIDRDEGGEGDEGDGSGADGASADASGGGGGGGSTVLVVREGGSTEGAPLVGSSGDLSGTTVDSGGTDERALVLHAALAKKEHDATLVAHAQQWDLEAGEYKPPGEGGLLQAGPVDSGLDALGMVIRRADGPDGEDGGDGEGGDGRLIQWKGVGGRVMEKVAAAGGAAHIAAGTQYAAYARQQEKARKLKRKETG